MQLLRPSLETEAKLVMARQGLLFSGNESDKTSSTDKNITFESQTNRSIASKPELLRVSPGEITLFRNVLKHDEGDKALARILDELPWQQPTIRMHGKLIPIPRLQVWMGDDKTDYRYSGKIFSPEPWHPIIFAIKQKIESLTSCKYNSVLCNLYRNGQDSVSWHADDEPELCKETPIASFSLGALRRFDLKHKVKPALEKVHIPLEHNTLLVMSPEIQNHWQHQLPKTKKVLEPRINLTFRKVRV